MRAGAAKGAVSSDPFAAPVFVRELFGVCSSCTHMSDQSLA